MKIRSLLLSLLGPSANTAPPAKAFTERRHPAYRCAGCNGWGQELIFMSNGRDYCLPCARRVSGWFGSLPAGRRHDDITSLDGLLGANHREERAGAASV